MAQKSKLPLILEALRSATAQKRGLTQGELTERSGISKAAVSVNIRKMQAERKVYICGWMTDVGGTEKGGSYQARYRLGNRPDTPKPPPMTVAEAARRFRQRMAKTGEIEDIRAQDRARYWRKQPARRDPLAAALFGGFTAANDSSNRESA